MATFGTVGDDNSVNMKIFLFQCRGSADLTHWPLEYVAVI